MFKVMIESGDWVTVDDYAEAKQAAIVEAQETGYPVVVLEAENDDPIFQADPILGPADGSW
jgi:ribosomal protein S2